MPLVASVMPCGNQTCSCELCTYQLLSWHAVPPGSLALPGAQRWSHCAPTACAGTLSVHGQSPTKKQHSHVILCVPPWFVDLIPYSGKLLREKTFANFAVLWLFMKVFSVKFGMWHSLAWHKRAICGSFSYENRIFHQFAKVFSLKFPAIRYMN